MGTLYSPQFWFSVSCYFEILDLCILVVFGIWITLMSLTYISLRARIFVLASQFAPLSSVCNTIHSFSGFLDVAIALISVDLFFPFYVLFVHCF